MANDLTEKLAQDMATDIVSFGKLVNGDENTVVTTRTGNTYPSAERAINIMFQNGGLPTEPFETFAEMETDGASLPDGQLAMVYNESVNNGLYVKEAGTWVKSAYDPITNANKYTDEVRKSMSGVLVTPWELGSFSLSGDNNPTDFSRARKKGVRLFAPNTLVQAESTNPNVQLRILLWDKDGNFSFASNYTSKTEVLVAYEYNILARYTDNSRPDLVDIENSIVVKIAPPVELLEKKVAENTQQNAYLLRLFNGAAIEQKWEYGSVTGNGGRYYAGTNRICTVPFKNPLHGRLKIALNSSDQRYIINLYDKDGVAINPTLTWQTAPEREVDVDGYYSIVLSKKDDTPLSPDDAAITINHSLIKDETVENRLLPLILTGEYKTDWESGSYTAGGNYWANNRRLRMAKGKVAFEGRLTATALNPDQLISVVTFDNAGLFIRYSSFLPSHDVPIDGYFDLLVKWSDDRIIRTDDANVSIKLRQNAASSNGGLGAQKIDIPQFSSVPYGYLLGKTLPELQTAFEAEVSKYQGTTLKESIGMSTDGLHEMFAYTLTPDSHTTTIAITMHTHGNERWNPLGFFALLGEMSKEGAKHPYIKWLRDNVKWYVVPFASPMAVVANTRTTAGVNLNRNYDFMWETGDSKGPSPLSLNESRNITDFFRPKKAEIDYHLDLHDIPGGTYADTSHQPANARNILFREKQDAMRDYLASINGASGGATYVMNAGGTSNWFMGVLGIPAITHEHVTQHWLQKGLSADQQIAKSLEQTCGFIYMFTNLMSDRTYAKDSAYYTRDHETSFCSREFGNHLWTNADVESAFEKVGFLSKKTGDFTIFTNTNKPDAKTILVLSGTTADGNDSDLTALRVMERIDSGEHMYLDHLKNSNLIVAPTLNGNEASEAVIRNRIQALIAEHTPDYTLLLETAGVTVVGGATVARSAIESNFTAMTSQSDVIKSAEIKGYDAEITGRYTSLFLGSDMPYYSSYPHNAAKWVGLVANDLASYFAKSQ